jgi:hypothetical protein
MKNNQKAEQLIKVMQNQTPEIDFTPQEMINAIESELLETLWMELANLDKIVFQFTPYDAEARGSTFGPIDDEWIREYFSNPNEYIAWVDIEYEIDYENILDAIEQDFSYYETYVNYVFSLEYGLNNNHLNISPQYNSKNYLRKAIDNLNSTGEREYEGIEAIPIPNKDKIIKILKDRGYMYGELDLENKKIIINSLIETTKDPHESRSWCFSGRESESLLDLIKLHPKTPDELKEIIKQNTKT